MFCFGKSLSAEGVGLEVLSVRAPSPFCMESAGVVLAKDSWVGLGCRITILWHLAEFIGGPIFTDHLKALQGGEQSVSMGPPIEKHVLPAFYQLSRQQCFP